MGKGMRENQILVVIKEPGKGPVVEPLLDNTLEAFQKAVGGFIEAVTIATDLVIICNEEGRLMELPHNVCIDGVNFCGTILAVGTKGDEFSSLKASVVPSVMHMLEGDV